MFGIESVASSMPSIVNTLVVEPFIIHSRFANQYIAYLIAIDLHRNFKDHLYRPETTAQTPESRFVEIESLQVFIHDGTYKSIEYRAVSGRGYRLPSIGHNAIDGRQNYSVGS